MSPSEDRKGLKESERGAHSDLTYLQGLHFLTLADPPNINFFVNSEKIGVLEKIKNYFTRRQFLSTFCTTQFKIYVGLPSVPECFPKEACQRPLAPSLTNRDVAALAFTEPDWHLHSLRSHGD